uniref:NADH-ubiquinone oxidoreductase chain 2 n=1 Tax=Phytoseiulus persimilis TaxID=44414 RepID=D5HKW5_PHYPM|nr:NADH dehydrogenase subunit 2 [Phytoseiulus persimilis]
MYKYIIICLYFMSLMFCISSNNMFIIWIFIEFNLMFYIPLYNKMNFSLSNSMMKYFIIQSISSSMFLFFLLMNNNNINLFNLPLNMMLLISMWIKMGFFPFSSWYFQMSENLEWFMWFMLNTLQKMIPLWVISMNMIQIKYLMFMLWINSIFSMIEIWNQISIRWIINSSSLNHFSWMILNMTSKTNYWETYFFIYFMISLMLYMILMNNNWNSMLSMFNNKNSYLNILFSLNMMNMMGLPPFLGFFPKLMIIQTSNSIFMILMLTLNNIIISIIYLTLFLPLVSKTMKINIINTQPNIKINISMMNLSLVFLMMFIYIL